MPEANIRALKPQVRERYMPQIPMLLVSGEAGGPLGFIGCHENRTAILFVSPENRGTGVGKQLLQYAMEHLQVDEVT